MGVQAKTETLPKVAASVSAMCRQLRMSRSQFYWHARRGTFHAPLHLPSNQRPYFKAAMVEDNLRARASGVSVTGEYVLFYERLPAAAKAEGEKPKSAHSALLEGLKASGLERVTADQVGAAVAACFPHGTNGHDDSTVLTSCATTPGNHCFSRRFGGCVTACYDGLPAPEAFGCGVKTVRGLAGGRSEGVDLHPNPARMQIGSRREAARKVKENRSGRRRKVSRHRSECGPETSVVTCTARRRCTVWATTHHKAVTAGMHRHEPLPLYSSSIACPRFEGL